MKNFYLIYGIDRSIIDNELDKLLKKLKIDDVVKYRIPDTKIEDIIEDASIVGMFSSQKVIVVENAVFFNANKTIDNISLLEEYLEHYNKDNYMIFIDNKDKIDTRKKITKKLKEIGEIISCNKEDREYFKSFINNYLQDSGYKLDDVDYFLDYVGMDLNNMKTELDKLFMYKLEDKVIYNEDIKSICLRNYQDDIFTLTDAIIAKDTTKALEFANMFLNNGYEEMQLIFLFASQFRFLFQVKRLANKNKNYKEIAQILEVNPYRVKFSLAKVARYTEDMILDELEKLAKMDTLIKSGKMNKHLALEMYILGKSL